MGKYKKGQITIFVIIAIIIIAVIVGFFVLRGGIKLPTYIAPEFRGVNDKMEFCLENAIYEAIYFNGLQGGYYSTTEPKETYDFLEIPVYLDKSTDYMPSEAKIESELGKAIKESMKLCAGNFSEYGAMGYSFTIGEITSAKAPIVGKKITSSINWPITVRKEESSQTFATFSKDIDFDFTAKYNLVKQFIDEQAKDPANMLLSYTAKLASDNNFTIETIELRDKVILYTFIFPEKHKEQEFIYSFIVKYS